jgi:C4-dicarboxylate-specific signal transduction histidine kinase
MLDVAHFSRLGAMGEMASEIAHEINQPLTAISIYSDACRRSLVAGKISHEKVVQAFDNINQQAVRAGEVIQRIREFASRKELQRTELSVNDIINDILYLLRAEIGSHNIELVLDLKDDLPMVLADKILVEQVIINLARNSIEAMEMVDKSDRMLMLQSSLSRPDEIEISIRDTGPGLSSEKLELIFSPFYTTKDDGMGMGLAICQTIIHSHHGRLWAALNERGGTTLSFTLPVIHGGETNAT